MADDFDPYYTWLGIPPKDQPPNHYRLLGVERFESNPDVIENAADRQMAHIRLFQNGPQGDISQKLLNEITSAKLCLLAPAKKAEYDPADSITPMLESAWEHCDFLDSLGFTRYCVSLKDSDPNKVIDVNRRFAERRPDVPLHLGVTEAGLPPDGVIKTRIAFEQLISRGIGDTIRVSLTVPNNSKPEEIQAGRQILADIAAGRVRSVVNYGLPTLNIIACPSCSRVENQAFIELAQQVKEMANYAKEHAITIAVMGCRVNGPGETDDADLGLWCGPNYVNLKRGNAELGAYAYDDILRRLKTELDALIASKS